MTNGVVWKVFDFLWMSRYFDYTQRMHVMQSFHLHTKTTEKWKYMLHSLISQQTQERKMLRLTSSPFSLSFPSISNLNLLPSFPPTSLFYLPSSSTTFHTTSLRIHTPPPLSSSLSSFSVDQTTSISQVYSNTHFSAPAFIIVSFIPE